MQITFYVLEYSEKNTKRTIRSDTNILKDIMDEARDP